MSQRPAALRETGLNPTYLPLIEKTNHNHRGVIPRWDESRDCWVVLPRIFFRTKALFPRYENVAWHIS